MIDPKKVIKIKTLQGNCIKLKNIKYSTGIIFDVNINDEIKIITAYFINLFSNIIFLLNIINAKIIITNPIS
jgi:hypothetical protein